MLWSCLHFVVWANLTQVPLISRICMTLSVMSEIIWVVCKMVCSFHFGRSTVRTCACWPNCSWTTRRCILTWNLSSSTSWQRWTDMAAIWWAISQRSVNWDWKQIVLFPASFISDLSSCEKSQWMVLLLQSVDFRAKLITHSLHSHSAQGSH